MKKEYISPDMLVVTLQTTGMMAASPLGKYDKPVGTSGALSRRQGMDYDDEEEDDF